MISTCLIVCASTSGNLVLPVASATSAAGGSWGEVPPAQGGVVIPYLGSYNLSAAASTSSKLGVSFGYSDCLKWGYSNDIQLAAFNAAQAADVLGLDLARVSD